MYSNMNWGSEPLNPKKGFGGTVGLWQGIYWPKGWAEMEEGGLPREEYGDKQVLAVGLSSLTEMRKNTRGQQHTKNVLMKVEGWKFAVLGTHFLKPHAVAETATACGISCPCLLWIGVHACVLVKIDSVWSWLLAIDKETSRVAQLSNPVLDTLDYSFVFTYIHNQHHQWAVTVWEVWLTNMRDYLPSGEDIDVIVSDQRVTIPVSCGICSCFCYYYTIILL